jgi:hypothetical protein
MTWNFVTGFMAGVLFIYFLASLRKAVQATLELHRSRVRKAATKPAQRVSLDDFDLDFDFDFDFDFDLDYNRLVIRCNHYSEEYDDYCALDSRHNVEVHNGTILHKGSHFQWLQDAIELPKVKQHKTYSFLDPETYANNEEAYKRETELAMSIAKEFRGFGLTKEQCNNLSSDPYYPYYCVRHKSHIHHVDPKVRRHGYAGVFWT